MMNMKKSKLLQIIKEEVKRVLKEGNPQDDLSQILTPEDMKNLKYLEVHHNESLFGFMDLYEKLFDYYSGKMPYGIQKAKSGDPDTWIMQQLKKDGII